MKCQLIPVWPASVDEQPSLVHADLKQACIHLLSSLLTSTSIEAITLRESMLDSGICKAVTAISAACATPPTDGGAVAGQNLLVSALDIFSALLRPTPGSGGDTAEAVAELKPLLRRLKPAALDAAAAAMAAAQHGRDGRTVRRAALSLAAMLALFPACHPEIFESVPLKPAVSQVLSGAPPPAQVAAPLCTSPRPVVCPFGRNGPVLPELSRSSRLWHVNLPCTLPFALKRSIRGVHPPLLQLVCSCLWAACGWLPLLLRPFTFSRTPYLTDKGTETSRVHDY